MAKATKRIAPKADVDPQAVDLVMDAVAHTKPNTLASWLAELESLVAVATELPRDVIDGQAAKHGVAPHEYVIGYARHLHDNATICSAFIRQYPDPIASEARAAVGRVLRASDDVLCNSSTYAKRAKLTGQDPVDVILNTIYTECADAGPELRRMADVVATYDTEHGQPDPPKVLNIDGNFTIAELAKRVRAAGPEVVEEKPVCPIQIIVPGVVTYQGREYRATSAPAIEAMKRLVEAYPGNVKADNWRWGRVRKAWGGTIGELICTGSGAGTGSGAWLSVEGTE